MMALDFSMAKLAHQQWKFRLRSFLDGIEEMSLGEAVSHRDCDFGKWLYSEGLDQYSNLTEMQRLEKIHEELHTHVRSVIELKNSGNPEQAEAEYQKVADTSAEVTRLIDSIVAKAT